MNREIIRDELKWLMEAINEQFEAIREHGEKIPQIELDILMENVRKFYQDLRLLQRFGEPVPIPETAGTPARNTPPPPVETPPPAPSLRVEISEPDAPGIPAPVREQEEELPVADTPVHFTPAGPPQVNRAPTVARKPAKAPEPDLFAEEEPTFSIRLKSAREMSLGPKGTPTRIDNLKAAISINEKFMFINELFDGNLREYNETIETLNGFKDLSQAADYLDLMRRKNFWNTGSNAFRKLQDLVERRF